MRPWKLSNYSPAPDVYPIRDWYDDQGEEIQAEFDAALQYFCANEDWTEAYGLRPLTKQYLGLHEIRITAQVEDDEVEFGVIGAWRPDSSEFVLFMICDRFNDEYFPCLDAALKYWRSWEQKDPKGGVHDHRFFY